LNVMMSGMRARLGPIVVQVEARIV
jgi:hypothetical protein